MNKQRTLWRVLTSIVGCALVLCMGFALSGCGTSDEEMIRAGISKELDALKNPTSESLKEMFNKEGSETEAVEAQFEALGLDFYEFCEHLFKNFDYTIDEISIDGDKATVDLTVQGVNLEQAIEQVTDEVATDIQSNPEAYQDMLSSEDSVKEVYGLVFDKLYDHLDTDAEQTEHSGAVYYNKVDNTWVIDEDSVTELAMGMFGGLDLT